MREPVGESAHPLAMANVAHHAKVTGGRDRETFSLATRTPLQCEGPSRERCPLKQLITGFTAR